MALEVGLQALKMLYQLAKMIKEARDNVIYVQDKLESAESLEDVIEIALSRIGPDVPEHIMKSIEQRLALTKRTSRRMRLKYEPLGALLVGLGGSASKMKAQSNTLKQGVAGCAMALGTLAVILRKHITHSEKVLAAKSDLSGAKGRSEGKQSDSYEDEQFDNEYTEEEGQLATRSSKVIHHETNMSATALMEKAAYKGVSHEGALRLQAIYATCHDLLNDTDGIVIELKSLDKEVSEGDEEGDASAEKAGADAVSELIPVKDKDVKPVSYFHQGLDVLFETAFQGHEVITDEDLEKGLGDNYSPEVVRFFRRQIGVGDEIIIHADAFKEFLTADSNVGIRIAALCSYLMAKLSIVGLPDIVIEACELALTMAAPLIRYSLAFGLLLACEDLRAKVKDDPDEMAALEEEASEKALRQRMNTIRVFAIDFKEAFDHGYSPDAALLAGVCMEASTSFCGMGPSTYRRLQLLMAIVAIANVEVDKKAIAIVDHDLRAELSLLQSLGSTKGVDQLSMIHENIATSFDARRMLSNEETQNFWTSSFGRECFEVSWSRFRIAFVSFYGRINAKETKRMQLMLLDHKGMVTIEHVRAFEQNTGSLRTAVKRLGTSKSMPRDLIDASVSERPNTVGGAREKDLPLSPTEKRQAQLRLFGVVEKA